MRRSLKGMVVAITGASSGIGAALAETLASAGANLVLGARRIDRLEALNARLGGAHLILRIDVSDPADCVRLIETAASGFGRLDTLVCNAGYGFHSRVAEATAEQLRAIFQTNVFGTTDCIRAAIPVMRAQDPRDGWRGQVMIVSSALARRAIPYFGAYSATKAAQLSLAESMRVELAASAIAVTSVHPVGTATEFGQASAQRSGGRRPRRIKGEVVQSSAQVARAMRRAIETPRPEVWPYAPSRWALSLSTLLPRLADNVLKRRGAEIMGDVEQF